MFAQTSFGMVTQQLGQGRVASASLISQPQGPSLVGTPDSHDSFATHHPGTLSASTVPTPILHPSLPLSRFFSAGPSSMKPFSKAPLSNHLLCSHSCLYRPMRIAQVLLSGCFPVSLLVQTVSSWSLEMSLSLTPVSTLPFLSLSSCGFCLR